MRRLLFLFMLPVASIVCSSWGFFAHKRVNRLAVFTLPSGMIRFYKSNIDYLTDHAVDPDKRRYSDSAEAPRHFLDADHYGPSPFDSLPESWAEASKKYGEKTLTAYGTVPWQIQKTYNSLVSAFSSRDSSAILRLSAALGHYVADAHVPLHTTENYNGQLTGQSGIHAFWESRLPELFGADYDYFTGKAHYIDHPLKEAWKIVKHTFSLKDTVLQAEQRLSKKFAPDRKFSFSDQNGKTVRQYSEEYARAYHTALNGMVEQQLRSSIADVGSFWYSAWMDAGQPDLKGFKKKDRSDEERRQADMEEKRYLEGKTIGREIE